MCLFNMAIYVECYSTDGGREVLGEKETDRVKQRAVVFSLKEAVILGKLVCCSATDVCLNKDE